MIRPGCCPGGVVIHVYDDDHRLLLEHRVTPDDDPQVAEAAADFVTELTAGDVCLVGYDGDTGERFSVDDWLGR